MHGKGGGSFRNFKQIELSAETIDGLRAVAVISVLLFHAKFSTFPVASSASIFFFVISGFVYHTKPSFAGIEDGRYLFLRILRPARQAIASAYYPSFSSRHSPLAWFFTLAHRLFEAGKEGPCWRAIRSNLLFWSRGGYFDGSSDLKPLCIVVAEHRGTVLPSAALVWWVSSPP